MKLIVPGLMCVALIASSAVAFSQTSSGKLRVRKCKTKVPFVVVRGHLAMHLVTKCKIRGRSQEQRAHLVMHPDNQRAALVRIKTETETIQPQDQNRKSLEAANL